MKSERGPEVRRPMAAPTRLAKLKKPTMVGWRL